MKDKNIKKILIITGLFTFSHYVNASPTIINCNAINGEINFIYKANYFETIEFPKIVVKFSNNDKQWLITDEQKLKNGTHEYYFKIPNYYGSNIINYNIQKISKNNSLHYIDVGRCR